MAKKKPQVALVYDFDGTLSPGNMQEFGFIQATGKTKDEFWEKNRKFAEGKDANGILTYMYLMLDEAKKNNISLTRESFQCIHKYPFFLKDERSITKCLYLMLSMQIYNFSLKERREFQKNNVSLQLLVPISAIYSQIHIYLYTWQQLTTRRSSSQWWAYLRLSHKTRNRF